MTQGIITPKQAEILNFIRAEITSKGYPPTIRDICKAVHLKSTSSVHGHLEMLEKSGFIRRDPNTSRAIELIDDPFMQVRGSIINVPVVGQAAAGIPILAVENIESYFPVPAAYCPNEQAFMLRIKGESMINAGIRNGDLVLVSPQNTAENGEIIVALIDDSATVKTFYREEDWIRLQPENDMMEPIYVYDGDLKILGKVFGLFRMM
jgi:repressor LexA